MVRNQWSEEQSSQMKEYFDSKVRQLMESALLNLGLKMREMKMNKMLEQNKDKQYEVLRWVFDKVDGRQYSHAFLRELVNDDSDYTEIDLERISDYLSGEGLIKQMDDSGLLVQLTHKGIVEIQNSINNPQKPTEHFSVPTIQNFNTFNAPVGSFQQGNENIAYIQQGGIGNTQQTGSFNADELISKINELIESVNESDLSVVDKITVESDLHAIQKFAEVEITPEVSQKVESRLIGVKDILSTTSDLVTLGQVVIPMIVHFFNITTR